MTNLACGGRRLLHLPAASRSYGLRLAIWVWRARRPDKLALPVRVFLVCDRHISISCLKVENRPAKEIGSSRLTQATCSALRSVRLQYLQMKTDLLLLKTGICDSTLKGKKLLNEVIVLEQENKKVTGL